MPGDDRSGLIRIQPGDDSPPSWPVRTNHAGSPWCPESTGPGEKLLTAGGWGDTRPGKKNHEENQLQEKGYDG
ncbi:MAG: hypothetical protein D6762_06745, partial [Candidatus Neomarinimicrobiota bacterium]